MKYIIFIIVLYASFFSTLSDDRKWYYIDSVEIDGKMEKIRNCDIIVDHLDNKYFFESFSWQSLMYGYSNPRIIKYDNNKWTTLDLNENLWNFIHFTEEYKPHVDMDNSLWWITDTAISHQSRSLHLVNLKDNQTRTFSLDSIYQILNCPITSLTYYPEPFGLMIDSNNNKHILTEFGIITFNNKTFSIDTSFVELQKFKKDQKKDTYMTSIYHSLDDNLIYILGIIDYKNDSLTFKIFEKIDGNWTHLTSLYLYSSSVALMKFHKKSNRFYLVYDKKTIGNTLMKVYDIKKDIWESYEIPGYPANMNFTLCADFDRNHNFWYHQSAPAFKYIFIFENNTGQIYSFNYPENIPYLILHHIQSMRFDNSDNLWCSGYYPDSCLFVYAKENPLSAKNKNIEYNFSLSLSPNPVTEKLTLINIPDNATEFEIYDQFGNRQIAGLISGQIDVSLLPAGVYFLKLNNSQSPLKFLKI